MMKGFSFYHGKTPATEQINYAAFIVRSFIWFGKLGIGNENNKYDIFPNVAFYTMYNVFLSPQLA